MNNLVVAAPSGAHHTRAGAPKTNGRALLLFAIFTISGACGLVYEVVWVRQFSLIFGVTVNAIATVLSAFMAGLALGSYWIARAIDRSSKPLLVYAALEAGIGLSALILNYVLPLLPEIYRQLYTTIGGATPVFFGARFLLCFGLLMIPTTLMGGTLPVLSRWFITTRSRVGRQAGLLYAVNTFGAVLGVAIAGFVSIRLLGMAHTVAIAVVANLSAATAAALLSRGESAQAPTPEAPAPEAIHTPTSSSGVNAARLAVLAFSISGFCSLAYEVLWTRALVYYLHNSTYAFSAMLMTFLLGIALGSLVVRRLADRTQRPLFALGMVQVLIGATTIASLVLYSMLPQVTASLTRFTDMNSWAKALTLVFLQAFAVLLVPAMLMGATFPLATRVYGEGRGEGRSAIGRSIGILYGGNTIGAILGSLAAGFLLIRWFGLRDSFLVLVAINVFVGLWLVIRDASLQARSRLGITLAGGVLVVASPYLVSKYLFFDSYRGTEHQNIVFFREGPTDTVFVTQQGDNVFTRVIHYADGRGTAGVGTNLDNRYSGHLPMLLHPNPKRVLAICFGVGNTSAAIVTHPIEQLDIVELSANAFSAAPYFPSNDNVLGDPRVHPIIQDGRNFLLLEDRTYDLISLDPPEMHTEGVVNLYTKEFYELARKRLADDGMICTWSNVAMMPHEELRMMLRTFQEVFPHASVWSLHDDGKYLMMVGTKQPFQIDLASVSRHFLSPRVYEDMKRLQFRSPYEILATFLLGEEELRRYVGDAPVIVDDHTRLDFTVPMSVDANFGLSNAFSGHWVEVNLPGGQRSTISYYIDKARQRMSTQDDLRPFVTHFAGGERERQEFETALRARTHAREQWLKEAPKLLERTQSWTNF